MKILFPLHGLCRWNGGIDLVRLLVNALDAAGADRGVEVVFASPRPGVTASLLERTLRRLRAARAGHVATRDDAGASDSLLRAAQAVAGARPMVHVADSGAGIAEAARALHADVVLPTMVPLAAGAPPSMGYVFDFQHRHLPGYFQPWTRWRRDRRFVALARGTAGLIVNSRHAREDAMRFLEVSPEHVLALPFAPYALAAWHDVDAAVVARQYGLERDYVIVCNHFWMHKDHATALRAFAVARPSLAPGTALVLTGDPVDHRNPGHYAALRALSVSLGIDDAVHWLGLIPKLHQIALLKRATMLWQPTLFEGGPGGGCVYEAVGLGVPAVVSDIEINREVDAGCVRLFAAGDADDLARNALHLLQCRPERPARIHLDEASRANLHRLGTAIIDFAARMD